LKSRAHVIVNGRVQGVFFRSRTKHEADVNGVKGWILNRRDGRVEAIFEGDDAEVKKMIEFCKNGPPGARVTGVDVAWEEYIGEFVEFEIRY
jgi:acylphosphatase